MSVDKQAAMVIEFGVVDRVAEGHRALWACVRTDITRKTDGCIDGEIEWSAHTGGFDPRREREGACRAVAITQFTRRAEVTVDADIGDGHERGWSDPMQLLGWSVRRLGRCDVVESCWCTRSTRGPASRIIRRRRSPRTAIQCSEWW